MTMYKQPKQIRALNFAISEYLQENKILRSEKKNSPSNLLKSNAFIHKEIKSSIDKKAKEFLSLQSNSPLTSIELCSFNNWFRLHPEKQSGIEEITTSIHFPIKIKASKEDVIKCLDNGLKEEDKAKRIRISKAKAKAKLKLLKFEK